MNLIFIVIPCDVCVGRGGEVGGTGEEQGGGVQDYRITANVCTCMYLTLWFWGKDDWNVVSSFEIPRSELEVEIYNRRKNTCTWKYIVH